MPLVDVVLVLLIIFMLTAHVMEFGLEINVPEVKQVKDTNEDLPVISITRNGKMYLNEKPININQIATEVPRRFKNQKSVYVMADKATVYDPIAQVISTLDQAHLAVKLVTKPQENAGTLMEQNFHPDLPGRDLWTSPSRSTALSSRALTLHVTLLAGMGIYSWVNSHHDSFGAPERRRRGHWNRSGKIHSAAAHRRAESGGERHRIAGPAGAGQAHREGEGRESLRPTPWRSR